MIKECFRHCSGIGPKTENLLKKNGYNSWDDCLEKPEGLPMGVGRRELFLETLSESSIALKKDDLNYFVSKYPIREHWRILGSYYSEATYFDIETTGISWYDSHTTIISAYHRGELHTFVYGENLDDFLLLVDEANLIVSFNGNSFDIPYLEKTFNIPVINAPHVDLRWIAYHSGYRGGLKNIETELGIKRPIEISDIDGFEAVALYYRWQNGDEESKKYLISYCNADVISTCLTTYAILKEIGFPVEEPDHGRLFKLAVEPLKTL